MRLLRRRSPPGEEGETLLEVLLTVAVVGLAVTALIGAMTVTAVASDAHRRLADSEVVTRDFAEALKSLALHPASTTLTATVTTHNVNNVLTLHVGSSTGFPTPPFGIAVDTEEFNVTTVVGTTWTATALGSEGHALGANARRYDACPTAAQMAPTFSLPPGSNKISVPVVGTPLFYGASAASVTCAGYWNGTLPNQVCTVSGDHLTICDPATIQVPVTVTSTDTTNDRKTSTTTNVLVRRGNV
jgi:hypothetical protein